MIIEQETIAVATWGPPGAIPIVLVHGGVLGGAATWSEQRPLADRWQLRVVDRRGYGASPDRAAEDHVEDGHDVAALLGDGAHLVGHSFGGFVALVAAALRPDAVRSLTLIEPPAFDVVDPAIAEALEAVVADPVRDDRTYLARFLAAVGSTLPVPDPLPPALTSAVRLLRTLPGLTARALPLDAVAAAPFPTLLVSGGHDAGWEDAFDVLAARLGARREVVAGMGHGVPRTGVFFNVVVERFWRAAG